MFDRPIVTARLILRPIGPADFDDVHSYMSRPDVARWLPEPPYTLEKSRDRHPGYSARTRFEHDGELILLAIEHDTLVIGDLDLTVRSMSAGLVEIGWRLHPDHQGKGLATEAAAALLELAFDTIGARRAIASLDARNGASIAMCERLGMRLEAHHVGDRWFKGEWSDTLVYARLARE